MSAAPAAGFRLIALLVCAVLALGLLTGLSPVAGVLGLLIGCSVVGFARSGAFAIAAFAAITYFEILVKHTGPMLSPIKIAGGTLIVIGLAAAGTKLSRDRSWRPSWAQHPLLVVALAVWVATSLASATWAVSMGDAMRASALLLLVVLVYLSAGVLMSRLSHLVFVGATVLVAATTAAMYGFYSGAEIVGGRAIATFNDPNEYATALVAALCLGFGVLCATRSRLRKAAVAGCMVACVLALFTTQSRGGLVGLAAACAVVMATARGRERLRMTGGVLVGSALLAGYALTPGGQMLIERFTDSDSSGRDDLWQIAIAEFQAHPIGGVGVGNYPVAARDYVDASIARIDLVGATTTHNMYLQVLAETGVVGFAALAVFLAGTLVVLRRTLAAARLRRDARAVAVGRGLLAAIVGTLVCNMFLSGQYQEILWVLLGSATPYALAVRRRGERHDTADLETPIARPAPNAVAA